MLDFIEWLAEDVARILEAQEIVYQWGRDRGGPAGWSWTTWAAYVPPEGWALDHALHAADELRFARKTGLGNMLWPSIAKHVEDATIFIDRASQN